MMVKKFLKYLGIRIGVLILVLSIIIGIIFFFNDPHNHYNGEEHRHNMGIGFGIIIVGIIITSAWFLVLFIEGIMYYIKKEKNTLSFAFMLLLVLIIVALAFL